MKPARFAPPGALRAKDWEVRSCSLPEARNLVVAYHYTRGASNTAVHTHGLYRRADGWLAGVAWWIPPTRTAAESVNRAEWRRVLSLSRLVVHPDVPANAASFLMAASMRAIKKLGRFASLVTYADMGEGHTGAIYRAANWTPVGVTAAEARWVNPETGRHVARKAGGHTRTKAEMEALGYANVGRFTKHKFVFHFGDSP